MEECDIFGRTCFFETLENVALFGSEQCRHCVKECDYISFKKEIKVKDTLSTIKESLWQGKTVSGKYLKYLGKKDYIQIDESNKIFADFILDRNYSLIGLFTFIGIIFVILN